MNAEETKLKELLDKVTYYNSIIEETPYLSLKWVKENILNIKDGTWGI